MKWIIMLGILVGIAWAKNMAIISGGKVLKSTLSRSPASTYKGETINQALDYSVQGYRPNGRKTASEGPLLEPELNYKVQKKYDKERGLASDQDDKNPVETGEVQRWQFNSSGDDSED